MGRWGRATFWVVALWCLATGAAHAQFNDWGDHRSVKDRFQITLGGIYMQDEKLRNATSDVWTNFRFSYALTPPSNARKVDTFALFDLATGSRQERLGHFRTISYARQFIGLGIGATAYLSPRQSPSGFYVSASGGPYLLMRSKTFNIDYPDWDDDDDNDNDYSEVLNRKNRMSFGYRLAAGLRFARRYSLEGAFQDIGRLDGLRYSGISLTLAMRL